MNPESLRFTGRMVIQYQTEADFYEGIYQLVQKGLTFNARHCDLTITLLGGF